MTTQQIINLVRAEIIKDWGMGYFQQNPHLFFAAFHAVLNAKAERERRQDKDETDVQS